ncbi:hypothetical protein chiPu_0014148 [Chiloscyllium punctatum]|uniref:ABC1 atypical kinase-like domain-containing protein n=1 Tax=Chiloscyllium punctatum TaxID=137246 RepID=A0A401SZ25_CHIPU|nr:hypothetical protein [Chiloscyllium punctatum]
MAKWFLRVGAVITGGLALSDLYVATHVDPNDIGFVRIVRAMTTTAVISYDYMTALKKVEYGTNEYETVKSQVHRRSAQHLLDLCCANRGTFIKVGQHLGGLDYLLPEEYTSTLKILHSKAPQSSLQEIHQVIEEDLGREGSQLCLACGCKEGISNQPQLAGSERDPQASQHDYLRNIQALFVCVWFLSVCKQRAGTLRF